MIGIVVAVSVCVLGQVLYHILVKGFSVTHSPFTLVATAYLAGFVAIVVAGFIDDPREFLTVDRESAWRGVGIGLSIALVELGYIYAYRNGLSLGTGPLTVLGLTTVALVPVGLLYFGDHLTLKTLGGLMVTAGGLWLLTS